MYLAYSLYYPNTFCVLFSKYGFIILIGASIIVNYPDMGIIKFMGFSKNLRGELEYKCMLVKELAHATGIPKKTLDKYLLTEGSMPSADNALAIAQTLGVTVEYLLTGKEIPQIEMPHKPFSPEMRSIAVFVEPLPREKRKIVEQTVAELVRLLRKPMKSEPVALTTLQKVFLNMFHR